MADDPYRYFRIEARELVERLSKGVLELEKAGASPDTVGPLLRHAHTLKGAARVVRQVEIAVCAHGIEDALAPYRDQATHLAPEHAARVLGLVDEIASRVAALPVPGEPAAAPATAVPPVRDDAPLVVRTDPTEMDALLDGIAETTARVGGLRASAAALDQARLLADALTTHVQHALVEQLRETVRRCQRDLHADIDQTARELAQVREVAEHLRLVPAASMFTTLERTARDAAHGLGKQVTFDALGGGVRLEAHVLAAVQGALIQLVRNAVAHGIEPSHERSAAGKPEAGSVRIEVARRGRRALFTCTDDGRGVDLEAVRQVAVRQGLAAPKGTEAGGLLALLLRGGISTSAQVTEVAGRGIGLDVVRAAIDKLGGKVHVDTRAAAGTRFELSVPVSLAAIEALVVEADGITASIPVHALRTTCRVTERELSRTAQGESVVHEGTMVPFLPLASAMRLERTASRTRRAWAAVVLEAGGRRAAFGVDRLAGVAPVVVRPVPAVAAVDAFVAGAALDARGNPQLVLDPEQLVAAAYRERTIEPAAEPPPISVLVVDDSVTTRMLEQSILEAAGYDVDTAVSGEHGLEAARRKRYALFLVDVEMPGIDGFTFVERVRADPALRDIPAILVTSRVAADDRLRGEQAGAQGYIVKSEFDQRDLLARIERLVRSHV